MIQKIRDGLEKIDIFGQSINLTFRQEEKYNTSMGGFLSICIIGTIISFFYSNIINFFAMQNVTSTQEFTFADDPDAIILENDNFMFAVQIEQANFTANPYFNITVQQRHYYRDENGTQSRMPNKYIDLIPCTLDHFQPIFDKYNTSFKDQFEQQDLSNFLCPNLSDVHSKNMTVGGVWASTDYYFLKFSVTNCVNQTNSILSWRPQCQSAEALNTTLQSQGSFRFQVYTTNFLINPNRPKNYVQPYLAIDQFYTFVPDSMFVQSDIFFRPKKVTTDTGILMYPNKKNETFASRDYGDQRQQFEINRLTPNYYAAFYFNRSPYQYTITRKFQRLDELLSYLGGFAQFMIVIVGLVVRFYNRQHLIVNMANDLYEFDMNQKKGSTQINLNALLARTEKGREMLKTMKSRRTESVQKIQTMQAFTSKPEMLQSTNKTMDAKRLNKKGTIELKLPRPPPARMSTLKATASEYFEQFKTFVQKKTKIGIGFRLVLVKLIPISSLQNDECVVIQKAMYNHNYSSDEVNKELDIEYIIKQLHELNKLKKVLFSPEQITLFNFSHKPKITLMKDQMKRRSTRVVVDGGATVADYALIKQFTDLVNSYQRIMGLDADHQTDEQIRFNQRLVTLLGAELPFLLEKEIAQQSDDDSGEMKDEDIVSDREQPK